MPFASSGFLLRLDLDPGALVVASSIPTGDADGTLDKLRQRTRPEGVWR